MAQAQFPQVPSLDVPVKDRIGYGENKSFGKWDVAHPHPGFGKDPNIGNEFGHTHYPKMVNGVIVHSPGEENELTNNVSDEGPTIKEWVDAGYKASQYPPKGYHPKNTQEEIDEYVEAEKKAEAKHGWK